MSKYNDYGHFMIAVLEEAEKKCVAKGLGGLASYFHLIGDSEQVIHIIIAILKVGWVVFISVCALLVLGPIAFIAALAASMLDGIGEVIAVALAIYGGVKAIKLLYYYKAIPLLILDIGKKYKPKFDSHKGEYSFIDNLIDIVSEELLSAR